MSVSVRGWDMKANTLPPSMGIWQSNNPNPSFKSRPISGYTVQVTINGSQRHVGTVSIIGSALLCGLKVSVL